MYTGHVFTEDLGRSIRMCNLLWTLHLFGRVTEVLPKWTMAGVVPPVRPNVEGHDPDRSPYQVGLDEVVEMFAITQERADILSGLFDYREALHNAGLVTGFQWLDGSFLENIEDLEGRPPNDIDVVTFFELPVGQTQTSLLPLTADLFDPDQTKQNFSVDAYPFEIGSSLNETAVRRTAYWYSMWSHRRDGVWKGFAQIDLSPANDLLGRNRLAQKVAAGFGP